MMRKKIFLTFFALFISGVVIHAEESPQEFQGFNLVGYSNTGEKTWDVTGDNANILGNLVKLTNIVANAYGEEQTNLTAKQGTMDKATGVMHLQEDVVITTDTGAKLTTDSLDWDRNKDLVTTNDRVVLSKEGMTAVGTGAKGHPNLMEAQMNEDVTVTIDNTAKDPQSGIVTITCDGPMEVEYEKQTAILHNNVVAIDGDRKLVADMVQVFFDNTTKQIKEMICTGNVSIIQGESKTFSDKAVYNATNKKLTLSGNPKLIMYTQDKNAFNIGDTASASESPASQVSPELRAP